MGEVEDFQRSLRQACRDVYKTDLGINPYLAAPFGDALAFYMLVSGLDIAIARALANAGYFFPNDVIRASDKKLIGIKGLGPRKVLKIRQVMFEPLPGELSASVILDRLLGEDLAVPLPCQRDLEAIYN